MRTRPSSVRSVRPSARRRRSRSRRRHVSTTLPCRHSTCCRRILLKSRRFDLHFRRGRAFADLGLWGPARTELEAALPLVDPLIRRGEPKVPLALSKCSFWMLDVPAVQRYANEALPLAESLGRDDFAADAMSWLAGVLNAEGDVQGAVDMDRRAMSRVGGPKTFGLTRSVIALYHMGLIDEALIRAFQAVESARASQDPNFRVYALQHLAISLSGAGRYEESRRAFEEMRDFGRRHGVATHAGARHRHVRGHSHRPGRLRAR